MMVDLTTAEAAAPGLTDRAVEAVLTGAGLTVVAVVLLGAAALAWTGRWRAWARRPFWGTLPLHVFPGLGLLALLGAVTLTFDLPREGPLVDALILSAVGVLGSGLLVWTWGLWGTEPRWAQPAWLRDADRTIDVQGDAVNALFHLAADVGRVHRSREEVERAFAGEPELDRWNVQYVVDPAAADVDHVLGAAGSIGGRLVVHPGGLGFYAVAIEERMRDERPTSLLLRSDDLRATWTVPAGTDAAGERHDATLTARSRRSPYRRLVVATGEAAAVFELWGARRRADELAQRFGIERGPDLRGTDA